MRFRLAVFLLLLGAPTLRAQVQVGLTGPDFTNYSSMKKKRKASAPVALALDLAFGATVWAQVQVSTNGPVADLTALVRRGHYKLEIIEMILMSVRGGRPLKETVERRRKGAKLEKIALDYHLDYDKVHEAGLAVQEIVDRDYLPRFPETRPRMREEQR